jgi:hypothetical protein
MTQGKDTGWSLVMYSRSHAKAVSQRAYLTFKRYFNAHRLRSSGTLTRTSCMKVTKECRKAERMGKIQGKNNKQRKGRKHKAKKKKSTAIPNTRPWRLRVSYIIDLHMAVRLSALRTGCPFLQEYSWYSFLLEARSTPVQQWGWNN